MKLLILGGNGMAGHVLVNYFKHQAVHQVFYTTRDSKDQGGLLLDVLDGSMVDLLIRIVRPAVIINAIGVLNEHAEQKKTDAYWINGLLPHRLVESANQVGARVIHISTDCVFSGSRGRYTETDPPDGTSAYALTKILGEIHEPGHLTIRTSIIGPEIRSRAIGLMHWFMQQSGEVAGYTRVMWNGVTTLELAKAIDALLNEQLDGLIHLAVPQPISKHDLLVLFKRIWSRDDITIRPEAGIVQDKTLLSTRKDLQYQVPSYETMLQELHDWEMKGGVQ